jgi:hypothetical protein
MRHLFLDETKPLAGRDDIEALRRLVDAVSEDIPGTEKLFHMAKIEGPIGTVERILPHDLAHAEGKVSL